VRPAATALRSIAGAAVLAVLLVVPAEAAISPGDVIVADREADGGTGALIRVDPVTGQQSIVSDNTISTQKLFEDPEGVALDPVDGSLLVADSGAFQSGNGGVIRVEPDTGQQSAVSNNSLSSQKLFEDPRGIMVTASGAIYVVDSAAFQDGDGGVIKVDPATGQESAVSSNDTSTFDLFEEPYGITREAGGDLAVADISSPPGGGDDSGAIIGIDLETGNEFLISSNTLSGPDLFEDPYGLDVETNGNILVANASGVSATTGVIRVSRFSGQQAVVATGGFFSLPVGIAVDADSLADVLDQTAFGGDGGVIRVNPLNGQQEPLASNLGSPNPAFAAPRGVLVVPPICLGRYATIVGTTGTDTLVGTSGPDVIVTQGGNDIVQGEDGADLICGGGGRNRLVGGDGSDLFAGGPGADVILGNNGKDTVTGEAGPDKIDGGSAKDALYGAGGRDNLVGGKANDRLYGERGPDRLTGGKGNDLLKGGPGNDRLTGGRGHDRLRGGPGRDKQKQ
jgi:Ca2+-binding RTX toxin-like protein